MKIAYTTPKGTQFTADFPPTYVHEDYQEYAVAMNTLAGVWMDTDVSDGFRTGNIPLIKEVVWDEGFQKDRSFLFIFSAAVVQLSNSIARMSPLIQCVPALTKAERSTLKIKDLLEKRSDLFKGINCEGLFPEALGFFTVEQALGLFLKKFLAGVNKGLQVESMKNIADLDAGAVEISHSTISFLARLIYVRWTLGRPDIFSDKKNKVQFQGIIDIFQKPQVFGLFKKMGKISAENEEWFLRNSRCFFQEENFLSCGIAPVDKFITELLTQDRSQLVPVVSQYLNILSIIKSPADSCEGLRQSFQGLLDSFEKMASFAISEYILFWLGTSKELCPPKPLLTAFCQKHGVQLPLGFHEILSEKSDNFLNLRLFFETLTPLLKSFDSKEVFFQQMLYLELVKLYHAASDRLYDNEDALSGEKFYSKKQKILFLVSALVSIIEPIRKKIPPQTDLIITNRFSEEWQTRSKADSIDVFCRANEIYLDKKDTIFSILRNLRFYGEEKTRKKLSFAQLVVVSLKMLEIKKLFPLYENRDQDYFGMIFYKESCQEIFGGCGVDFFGIVLEELQEKLKKIGSLDPDAGGYFLRLLLELCIATHYFPHKMKVMEVIVNLSDKVPGFEISKDTRKLISAQKINHDFRSVLDDFLEACKAFLRDIDSFQRYIEIFYEKIKLQFNCPPSSMEKTIESKASSVTLKVQETHPSWSDCHEQLTQGKCKTLFSDAKCFLSNSDTLKEGALLMSAAFLKALESNNVSFFEDHVLDYFHFVFFKLHGGVDNLYKSAHYLLEDKLNAMQVERNAQLESMGDADLFSIINGTVIFLQLFVNNGRSFDGKGKEARKNAIVKLLSRVREVFQKMHPVASEAIVLVSGDVPSVAKVEEVKAVAVVANEMASEPASQLSEHERSEFCSAALEVPDVFDWSAWDTEVEEDPFIEIKVRAPQKRVKNPRPHRVSESNRASQASTAQVSEVSLSLITPPNKAPTVLLSIAPWAAKKSAPLEQVNQVNETEFPPLLPNPPSIPRVSSVPEVSCAEKLTASSSTVTALELEPQEPRGELQHNLDIGPKDFKIAALQSQVYVLKKRLRQTQQPLIVMQPLLVMPPLMWALPPPLPSQEQQFPSHEPTLDEHGNSCVRVRTHPEDPGMLRYDMQMGP